MRIAMWRRRSPMPEFVFPYRDVMVHFAPADLHVAIDFNVSIYVDGEQVILDREESMRFLRAYFAYLDAN